ncbi:MAG: hypothetical protein K5989_02960 [Lachnospiraceae bacterium]|nr:hypothetical protein [Lachnospiraceae bacterium]
MRRKLLAFMMGCSIAAVAFTGCGSSGGSGEKKAETAASTEETVKEDSGAGEVKGDEAGGTEAAAPSKEALKAETSGFDKASESGGQTEEAAGSDASAEKPGSGDAASAYKQAYLDKANELDSAGDADQFALIFLDEDQVPELVAVSSKGAYDVDQVFIYTMAGDKSELLLSDVCPGLEGHQVSYYEGQGVIRRQGAAAGERYVYDTVDGGKLVPMLTLSYVNIAEEKYFMDEEEISEDTFYEMMTDFESSYGDRVALELDSMKTISASFDNGIPTYTDGETKPYMSLEELKAELK